MKKICVIGSLNIDLINIVDEFPKPGETIISKEFRTNFGGKGANQAVAAKKLGADVLMVGRVGEDIYGTQYMEYLEESRITTDGLDLTHNAPTGTAVISVNRTGENTITIAHGANGEIDESYIDRLKPLLLQYDVFLLQLEIPVRTVKYILNFLKSGGKTVILDPAPAQKLEDSLYQYVDYITPNRTELQTLTGMPADNRENFIKAGRHLLEKGAGTVVVKAGSVGAYIIMPDRWEYIPAYRVEALDTTAAGDSFNAGLAVSLSQERPITECVQFASAVGALSTLAYGAQSAMPSFSVVQRFMEDHQK